MSHQWIGTAGGVCHATRQQGAAYGQVVMTLCLTSAVVEHASNAPRCFELDTGDRPCRAHPLGGGPMTSTQPWIGTWPYMYGHLAAVVQCALDANAVAGEWHVRLCDILAEHRASLDEQGEATP
jgi:hypothetical protein